LFLTTATFIKALAFIIMKGFAFIEATNNQGFIYEAFVKSPLQRTSDFLNGIAAVSRKQNEGQ